MTKKLLNALIIGLLSAFAAACGDAGEPIEGGAGLGEELPGEHEPADDFEEEAEEDEAQADEVDPNDHEEADPEPEAPFCGDGVIDDDEECDDGNEVDGDGCSAACEVEVFQAAAEGDVQIDIIVDDLSSNEEPLEQTCLGDIDLDIDAETLVGDGRCFLPANFMDYSVDATLDEGGVVEGEITVVLNNRPHVLPLEGSFDGQTLSLSFDGVTILVGDIRGVWDGTIDAQLD